MLDLEVILLVGEGEPAFQIKHWPFNGNLHPAEQVQLQDWIQPRKSHLLLELLSSLLLPVESRLVFPHNIMPAALMILLAHLQDFLCVLRHRRSYLCKLRVPTPNSLAPSPVPKLL